MASASIPRRLLGKLPAATFGPAFATLGSNVAIQGAAVLGSVVVARRLGADVRGEYAGAAAWCALLSALSDFGVSQAVPYRCAKHPMAPGKTIGTGLAYAAAAGITGALVGLLAALLILGPRKPQLAMALAAFVPSIPLMLVGTYASLASQGLGIVRTFNAIRLSLSLSTIVGITIAVAVGLRTSAGVMGSIVAVQTLATALSVFLLHRRSTAAAWRIDREEMRHLWGFGVRTHIGNLAWVANGRLDQMIMSISLSSSELGFYSIAASYAGLVFALGNATTDSGFARLAADVPMEERMARLRTGVRRLLKLSAPLGAGLALLGIGLLPLAFGAGFGAAVLPAAILCAGGIVLGLNYTLAVGLRASGHPILTSAGEGIGLLFTCIGLPLVLGRFGIIGTALLSVASYTATFLVLLLFVRRLSAQARLTSTTKTGVARS